MYFITLLLIIFCNAFAQEPLNYLKNFESKIYSLRSKGVQDFVIDIESDKMTKQLTENHLFAKDYQLIFRVYWTAAPERVFIEVLGLPEGFKELKEELKQSILPYLESVILKPFALKFGGYSLSHNKQSREIVAKDTSGTAPVPGFILKFDEEDKLVEIVGDKPVGYMNTKLTFEKLKFTDGKWILTKEVTNISENGQEFSITKQYSFHVKDGIGLTEKIKISTEHTNKLKQLEVIKNSDEITFSNFRINEGLAMKYFLKDQSR
jgi:predicted nuclease of restriction endonuclease-like RecB superfamily